MTTATKPLPPHGTYARANGSPGRRPPCHCEPCRTIRQRTRKQAKVNRQLGRGARISAAEARRHLALLRETMTWSQIAEFTGCDAGNLRELHSGAKSTTRRTTHNKILAVQPQPVSDPNKSVDSTGTVRRLQALRANGHSVEAIAKATGLTPTHLRNLCHGHHPTVRHRLATTVTKIFAQLAATPAPQGCSATMARNHATAKGWAPPGAWDDIDDPNAAPDLTAHCGTDRGWWLHTLKRIPGCEPCETAHQQWKQEHRQLGRDEFMRRLGQARAAATTREADLAHDARELMRVSGLDVHQAAERLGVSRNHLQQAMLRHPEAVAA